uniref:Uncharacterized protein n=1 Tax=Engystomops pustulosus TaxID=76066 RepID=A0AAV6YQZ5_ENGPU|nr:hypothetical protein GDO81_024591 [Engystomops pustulosus]
MAAVDAHITNSYPSLQFPGFGGVDAVMTPHIVHTAVTSHIPVVLHLLCREQGPACTRGSARVPGTGNKAPYCESWEPLTCFWGRTSARVPRSQGQRLIHVKGH